MSDVILKIQPTYSRRLFGMAILSIAAFVMFSFAFVETSQSALLKLILFLMGYAFLWQVVTTILMKNAALILSRDGLFDEQGRLVCALSNIAEIDKGVFSFKPSNGFLIRLHHSNGINWTPGLYWCVGKRIGIGGALNPSQTKELADKLLLLQQEASLGIDLL